MPRPYSPPSYRLHKPTGQAVVRLDGRDHYLGRHGTDSSREKSDRAIAEWLTARRASLPGGAAPATPPTSVGEVILAFWKYAQGHYRDHEGGPGHEIVNIRYALKPLRKLYGSIPAVEFGPLALRAVRDEMIRGGLARTTVNARVNRIRRAFRWAASVELVPVSVVTALATVGGLQRGRTAAPEPPGIHPVAPDAVEATLPYLSAPVAAMVRLQMLTGCRVGDAMRMRGCDLTPGEPTWEYRPAAHKNSWRGEDRVILLGPKAQEVVKAALKPDIDAYLFSPRDAVAAHHAGRSARRKSKPTPSERARRCRGGPGKNHAERYHRSTYLQAITRACDRAFPHPEISAVKPSKRSAGQRDELREWRRQHRWSPLQLRHTAASLIRARFGLEAAQNVLGHAKADVTQIYAERDQSRAREVMAEVG